jgi:hypothetical protein
MIMMNHFDGWDTVSELRSPAGLFFIPQAKSELKEHGWSDVDRVNLLIRPPELSRNPRSSHLVAKQNKLAKEMMNLALQSIFILRRVFQHAVKFYDIRPTCLLSLRRKDGWGFLSLLKFHWPRPGLNLRNLDLMASTLIITPPKATRK